MSTLRFLENLTRAADSLSRYRKVAEEVGAAEHVHLDDAIQAAMRRERWAEETGQAHDKLFEAQRGLTPNRPGFQLNARESVLSDLILSNQDNLGPTIDLMADGLKAGKWDDPVVAAVSMLADNPKRIGGFDLNEAVADYKRFGSLDKGAAPNPTIFSAYENLLPKADAPGIINAGESAIRAHPADVMGAAGLIDAESKLLGNHWKITSDWTNADLWRGDNALPAYSLQEDFHRSMWNNLEAGKVPITPTLVDFMEASVGSPANSRYFAADRMRPQGGYFSPEMIQDLAVGEAKATQYVKQLKNNIKRAGKGHPETPFGPKPENPSWYEPPSRPKVLQGMDKVPVAGTALRGTLNLLDAAQGMIPFARAPIYALGKKVTAPIIRAANAASDWTGAMDEFMAETLRGITRGSEEDRYLHMRNELTDAHLEAAAAKAEEHGLGSDYLKNLVQKRNEMLDWEKLQSPEKLADLQARGDRIRIALDATARMFRETGHPAFREFGDVSQPLSFYMPHVWPEGHPTHVPGDALHRFSSTSGRIFNPYLKQRTGQIGYEFSASHALHDYFRKAGQTIFLEPALMAAHPSTALFSEGVLKAAKRGEFLADANPLTRKLSNLQRDYLVNWINDIRGVPSKADEHVRKLLIDAATRTDRWSRMGGPQAALFKAATQKLVAGAENPRPALKAALMWNGAIMKGALGGSLGFIVKNSLQAPTGVEARRGSAPYMAGLRMFASKEGTRAIEEAGLSKEWNSWFQVQPEYDAILGEAKKSGLLDKLGPVGGTAKWLGQAWDDLVTSPLQVSENINRGSAYLAGIAHGLADHGYGLSGMNPVAEAIRDGKWDKIRQDAFDLTNEVNFIQGTLNRNPYMAAHPWTMALTQFTNYPYNLAETLAGWAKNDPTVFLKYLASTGYLAGLASRGGIATDNWLGAYGATPGAVLTGKAGELPFATAANQAITALSLALHPSATDEDHRRARDMIGPLAGMLTVKGYLQLARVQRTMESARTGLVTNRKGEAIAPFRGTADDYFSSLTGIGTTEQRLLQSAQKQAVGFEQEKAARAMQSVDKIVSPYLELAGKKKISPARTQHLERQMMEQLAVLQALGYDGREITNKLDQRVWEKTGLKIQMENELGLDTSSAPREEVQRPDNLLEMEDRLWRRHPELMTRWYQALETLPTPYRGLSNRPLPRMAETGATTP